MIKLGDIIDAQIFLFGQYGIPEHQIDAARFTDLRRLPGFKTLFHEARTAVYCGNEKPNFHSDAAIRQALDNFELGLDLLAGKKSGRVDGSDLKFSLKPNDEDMPEALWYSPITINGKIAARIGVNLHYERDLIVATIANIQGKNKDTIEVLKTQITPNTHWPVEAVTSILDHFDPHFSVVRGVASTAHPSRHRIGFDRHRASCLYDMTFRRAGMKPIRDSNNKVAYYELRK